MNLTFKLGSIPVRVDPSFLIFAAFLGWNGRDLGGLAIWIPVVFVGVLLHELGHALVGRSFGLTPRIDLVSMGGLTSWTAGDGRKVGTGKRIAISLAGPFTGITIGLAFMLFEALGGSHLAPPGGKVVGTIITVNLYWGIINLLPILPMDGGNVLLQSLNWLTKGRGEKPARLVSTGAAALVGAYVLAKHWIYPALLAGLFAVQNIQALRAASARANDVPLRDLLKSGFDALEHGEPPAAVRIANDVLSRATDRAVRADAVRLLAFGYLLSRAWSDLAALMESPAAAAIGDDEMAKFEQAARELGRPAEAERIAAVQAKRAAPTL
jgi:Zn-dependent protease